MQYPPAASNRSAPTPLADLGLTNEALGGRSHPVLFEVRREAGTFVCRGIAEDGRGAGAFRFTPDPIYANAIAETGLPPLTLRKHIVGALFDVTVSFAKAIVATGLPHVAFSDLIKLKIFTITPEDVSALRAAFPNVDLDDIVALSMMRVTPAYVEALRRARVDGLSVDNVAALRGTGIAEDFIDGLASNEHLVLSIDDVVKLHDRGA